MKFLTGVAEKKKDYHKKREHTIFINTSDDNFSRYQKKIACLMFE